jgi:hypothetical protein
VESLTEKLKGIFFLKFDLKNDLGQEAIVDRYFIGNLAKKLDQLGYALFWNLSGEDGLAQKLLLVGSYQNSSFQKAQNDFNSVVTELKAEYYDFKGFYDLAHPGLELF